MIINEIMRNITPPPFEAIEQEFDVCMLLYNVYECYVHFQQLILSAYQRLLHITKAMKRRSTL